MFQPTYHPNPNSDKIRLDAVDVFRYHTVIIHSSRTRKLHRKHSKIRINKHHFIICYSMFNYPCDVTLWTVHVMARVWACVTSWCSIHTSEWIGLLLAQTLCLAHHTLCYNEFSIFNNRSTSLWKLVANSELSRFCFTATARWSSQVLSS